MARERMRRSPISRREMLLGLSVLPVVNLLGKPAQAQGLSPEEKAKLKAELQRELERKVYNVDETLFQGINRAKNPEKLVGHERSHIPKIIAPDKVRKFEAFPVKIEIGVDEIHEMQIFHYVDWIALYTDDVMLNNLLLTPLFNRPIVTFDIVLERSVTLIVREHCQLHGVWENKKPIKVET